MKRFLLFCCLAVSVFAAEEPLTQVPPVPPIPKARVVPDVATVAREPYLGAIVVDAADGRVLFEENADAKGYPASVLKLMLLLTAMEQLQAGTLQLTDTATVSPDAVSCAGANLRLKAGEVFTVEELLYASMMHSANDAATTLAEKLGGGSVEKYLELINARAQALGMANSRFHSPSGLGPKISGDPYDVTTPRDLTLLCREILKHPEALKFTSARSRIFRPKAKGKDRIAMETHNYILDMVPGCDGLKTGYIKAAGYCIAGTAKQKEKRVIAVILGATAETSRNKKAAELLRKGLKQVNTVVP